MSLFRQFYLLLWKDLVLVKRNIVWTIFELVLPILITLPIVIVIVKVANISLSPKMEHEPFTLTGSVVDVNKENGFTKSIRNRWCNRHEVFLGYATTLPSMAGEATTLMNRLAERFNDRSLNLTVRYEESENALKDVLKNDYPNGTFCAINTYVGGIIFDQLDTAGREFAYRILMPVSREEKWHIDEAWQKDRLTTYSRSRIPPEPPYWSSGYLSIQYAIETLFFEGTTGQEQPIGSLRLQAFTEPAATMNSVAEFITLLPILWGICVLSTVLHVGREIAAEKATVRPFLSAMGLSTPMFYLTHITFSFCKCMLVFMACAIPITTVMQFVAPSLFIVVVLLYGLGAVVFGALIASIFNSSNSALKALIVTWCASIFLAFKFQPRIDQILPNIAYSLNVNGAFFVAVNAIHDHMVREKLLSWGNLFADSTIHFSLGYAMVMLILDIIWMSLATLIIDHVVSSIDFSFRSIFQKDSLEETQSDGVTVANTRNNENIQLVPQINGALALPGTDSEHLLEGSTEVDGARDSAIIDIDVEKLVKIWSTTGERAVDGLSLKAARGQVAVLLGHNGAGKSTTFASIAGIIRPTHGQISISGHNVATELSECRKNIGLCPQYNPLYDKLTVAEHLWLVHGLKNAPMETFVEEMDSLLGNLKLLEKKNEISMKLSGGMKRKLCVCMALIGNSKVVLLDEPTAGMDPGARKDVQEILEKEKSNRTILLTTHYMDEAERLGDWVFIMSYGRLVASGSTSYLKHKFGTGYLLTVVFDQSGNKLEMSPLLVELCQVFIPSAVRGEQHGQQLEIVLPENQKSSFVPLFQALEAIKSKEYKSPYLGKVSSETLGKMRELQMNITTFGLSLNTLEQVFLRIGELAEKERMSRQVSHVSRSHSGVSTQQTRTTLNTQVSTRSEDSYQALIDSQTVGPEKRGVARVVAQYVSIFRKRTLYMLRNWPQLIGQVILPLLLLGLVVFISNLARGSIAEGGRSLSLAEFGPSFVIFHGSNLSSQEGAHFQKIVSSFSSFDVRNYPIDYPMNNITKEFAGEIPGIGFGVMVQPNGSLTAYFNYMAFHSLPTVVSAISQARFPEGRGKIFSAIYTYSEDTATEKVFSAPIIDILLSPLLVLVFALLTSSFVMFLVEERESKFAHQQSLTGISPFVFWSASLFFDFIFYAIVCAIFIVIFVVLDWMHGRLLLVLFLWFLYFYACVPFIYAVSFLFSSPSKANVLLILWQIVASFAAMFIMLLIIDMLDLDENLKKIIRFVLLFVLPSFAFGTALIQITSMGLMFMSTEELLEWDQLGKNIVCMALFGTVSSVLFLVLQFKSVRQFLQQLWGPKRSYTSVAESVPGDLPICTSVAKEHELVCNGDTKAHSLVVSNLTKFFGGKAAVNDLCLAVEKKECFGLLGVNGAGKTTTFNILTGQSFASSGSATIGGRNVTEQIPIGYCPQFDALMLDYTGKETLEILAQMHGFTDYKKKARIVLASVGMMSHADKLVRYYSGGQKRKLSVGIALLAPTKIIILDEPTAGIDPKARREIWELLLRVREHSETALLLTSHSMDECEALCSRIAVLNKGSLIAIGTSQDLKSLYGNSYTMTLTIKDLGSRQAICERVGKTFSDSVLKTSVENKTSTLKWQLKKETGDMWSQKFRDVEKFARETNVDDYCLAQTSLEDTFLRLAGIEDPVDHENTPPIAHV